MEKYVLNTGTQTLHETNKCTHSRFKKVVPENYIFFRTEDDAIAYGQLHIRKCKLCFKNK